MKLEITYDNGETRHVTNDLNKEQLNSLCQYITDGVETDKETAFDHWKEIKITK